MNVTEQTKAKKQHDIFGAALNFCHVRPAKPLFRGPGCTLQKIRHQKLWQ